MGRDSTRKGRRSLSRTFTREQGWETGHYEGESSGDMPSFRSEIMMEAFQMAGMFADLTERLQREVR